MKNIKTISIYISIVLILVGGGFIFLHLENNKKDQLHLNERLEVLTEAMLALQQENVASYDKPKPKELNNGLGIVAQPTKGAEVAELGGSLEESKMIPEDNFVAIEALSPISDPNIDLPTMKPLEIPQWAKILKLEKPQGLKEDSDLSFIDSIGEDREFDNIKLSFTGDYKQAKSEGERIAKLLGASLVETPKIETLLMSSSEKVLNFANFDINVESLTNEFLIRVYITEQDESMGLLTITIVNNKQRLSDKKGEIK